MCDMDFLEKFIMVHKTAREISNLHAIFILKNDMSLLKTRNATQLFKIIVCQVQRTFDIHAIS